jgi:uncharacterized protein YggE
MKERRRLVAGAGAVTLAAAALTLFALPAGAQAPDETRTITVNGSASVTAVPDRAEWSFGVQTQAGSAGDALKKNGAAMQTVIAALKAAGIAAADLRTEQVSLFPQTDEKGQVISFTASNSVHAVIHDIAKAGSIVDAAAEAGANNLYGPTLTISDSEDLYEQALGLAYDQAKAKAERLASKAGVTLGRVVSITEGGAAPIAFAGAAADRAEGGSAIPIQPGTNEIQGFVTVAFAIA